MASRTALIEEGAVDSVHAKLIADRAPPQVGLIVGKRSVGARDLILALVPFPDGWNASGKKGDGDGDVGAPCTPSRPASGGTPLHIDVDSIVEHATQVTRMLPGGLDVVGAYAFAAEQAWRSASTALANAVVDAAEAAAFETRTFEKETNDPTEQFLLHLSAEDKSKTSLRRVDRSSSGRPFTSLPPAESREGKALANVVRLDAEHAFEWSVVLPSKRTTKKGTEKQHTLRSLLESACALEIARVEQSEILVENATWDDETAIATVPRRKKERVDEGEESRDADDETDETVSSTTNVFKLHAELLAPPLSCTSGDVTCDSRDATRSRAASDATDGAARADPSSQRNLDGEPSLRLTFKGVVSARAYSSARETVCEASSDLRRDIARSLRSRLDAFLDRADDALENDEHSQNDNALSFLERRFFASEGLTDGSGEPFADRLADAISQSRRVMNDSPKNERLTLALPRRAWVEWRQVGLAVCDYLADSETEADVVARCAEVMGFDVAEGRAGVLVAEREGLGLGSFPFPGGASFSGANGHDNKGAEVNAEVSSMKRSEKRTSGKKPSSKSSSYAAYALGAGVALLSAGLANLYMTGGPSEIAECVGEMCDFAAEVA